MKQYRAFRWSGFAALLVYIGCSISVSAQPILNDSQLGSFLVFPVFDIREDYTTQLRITNTDPAISIQIQLNFICPGSKQDAFCDTLNTHLTITPHGTAIINVTDHHPPCDQGFVVAFAENGLHQAISFNALLGSYRINWTKKRLYSEAEKAISIQSVKPSGEILGTSGGLQFGADPDPVTQDYVALGNHLFTDFRAVNGSGSYGSNLILLTLGTIAGASNPVSLVAIDFWNENEVAFSTSLEFVCWTRVRLDQIDFNFLSDNLETPHGSMTIIPVPNCPIPGTCPPILPFDPAVLGAIEETAKSSLTVRNLYHGRLPKSAIYVAR